MAGPWRLAARGLRVRVVYFKPIALSRYDGHGSQYLIPGRSGGLDANARLPRKYWGTYPVYRHGQTVEFEVEVLNLGPDHYTDVVIAARQETFDPRGKAGEMLPAAVTESPNGAILEPGDRLQLRGSFEITSDWETQGSLEQTHVVVWGVRNQAEAPEKAADMPQAGLIDPPIN
jgi:hypothetical protein